ncbi:hypothetical protein [Aliivibrio salmonicida]|uniref:hypothetical protein n=1 Tax=Aliivibrio salmonicida TaxID=40269 RepID=UPI003D0EF2CB
MTHSNAINSTITKETQATNVSSFELSGVLKNEFLQSFSSGKLRKNAKKKIQQLLGCASSIELFTQSRRFDGCYESNEPVVMDQVEFWAWYEDNYNRLEVSLRKQDGELASVTFSDCPFYFCNDVILTFGGEVKHKRIKTKIVEDEPKHVKPRMTYSALLTYLSSGFVSPLNHGVVSKEEKEENDPIKDIVKIVVVFSESSAFNQALRDENSTYGINKEISMQEYNRLVWVTLSEQKVYINKYGEGYGYDKTLLNITLGTGEVREYRHDISLREQDLNNEWALWVDYCRAEKESKTAQLH